MKNPSTISQNDLLEIRLEHKIQKARQEKTHKENIEPYTNKKIQKLYKFLDECEK